MSENKRRVLLVILIYFTMVSILCVLLWRRHGSRQAYTRHDTIRRFTIFGERCSGTNFLEQAMKKNFDLELTWKYGWKHEFGNHTDFSDSEDTLFLCIYRDPVDWINSLYRKRYHVPKDITTIDEFLTRPMMMVKTGTDDEIPNTRHIYTGEIYKDIFELRAVKLHFLLYEMPRRARHVEVFSYEYFCRNYKNILRMLKKKYILRIASNDFPEPIIDVYRGGSVVRSNLDYEKQIPASRIVPYLDREEELIAGYRY